MDEISLKSFKEKLNTHYSKDNGEITTESVVEEFSRFAISQNKENNPFFYSVLLSTIKHSEIPLSELASPNNTVIRQVIVEAKKTATEYQQKLSSSEEAKKVDETNININTVVKTDEDRIEQKQKVDECIEKYGGFEEFLHKATKEEIEEYIDVRKYEKVLDDADELLLKWINNPEIEFSEEEKSIIRKSKIAQKFGYDEKIGSFTKGEDAEAYANQLERMRKILVQNLEANDGTLSKEQLQELYKSGNYDLVLDIKSEEEITIMVEQLKEDYKNKAEKLKSQEPDSLLNNTISINGNTDVMDIDDFSNVLGGIQIGEIPEGFSQEVVMQQEVDKIVERQFQELTNPALVNDNINIAKENIEEIIEEPSNTIRDETSTKEEIQVEQNGEILYNTPTFKVEKKGLAKWFDFDKLKKSRNPFAKLITGSMWKKQDNLLNEAEPQKYEDKPSTGRFDSTDTQLMPVGKGTRNSIIQAMDKISSLFKGSKKEKQPAKVIKPVTTFNDRYVVDTDSLGSNSVIVPTSVSLQVETADKRSGTPVKDDGLIK